MCIGCAALAVRELRIREMKDIRILAPGYPMKHITYIWRFPERSCFTIQLLWSFLNPYYPRNFLHCHLRVSPSTLDRYNQSFTMKGKQSKGRASAHCYVMHFLSQLHLSLLYHGCGKKGSFPWSNMKKRSVWMNDMVHDHPCDMAYQWKALIRMKMCRHIK